MGKVFWAGALAAMGDRDPREVEQALHELARKELVRPPVPRRWRAKPSTASGTCSCATSATRRSPAPHAPPVTRQPPRGSRRRRASGSKTWPTCSPTTTVRRSSSTGPPVDEETQEQLQAQAVRYLALAGERALALDVDRPSSTSPARSSSPRPAIPTRASLLERWAQATQQQGRLQEARQAFEEALALYRDQGEPVAAGRVLTRLSPRASTGSAIHERRS